MPLDSQHQSISHVIIFKNPKFNFWRSQKLNFAQNFRKKASASAVHHFYKFRKMLTLRLFGEIGIGFPFARWCIFIFIGVFSPETAALKTLFMHRLIEQLLLRSFSNIYYITSRLTNTVLHFGLDDAEHKRTRNMNLWTKTASWKFSWRRPISTELTQSRKMTDVWLNSRFSKNRPSKRQWLCTHSGQSGCRGFLYTV